MKTPRKAELNPIVLWAVDPFAGSVKLQREAALALKALSRRRTLQLQPVFVTPHPLPNLPEKFTRAVFEETRHRALKEFDRIHRGVKLPSLLPLAVLRSEGKSVGQQVRTLLDYAAEIQARMILATTRAKKGPVRWVFGSFVETLSLRSPIPLLTVNPSWKVGKGFQDILYPTDFSEESHKAFLKAAAFARDLGARLHLYHKYVLEPAIYWDFAYATTQVYQDWSDDLIRSHETQARKWTREAKNLGTRCDWEVDRKPGISAVAAILDRSAKSSCMIAMAGQSSRLEAGLLGSITRQVMRGAEVPVLVFHAERTGKVQPRPQALKSDRKPKVIEALESEEAPYVLL